MAIGEDIVKRVRLGEKSVLSGPDELRFQMKLRDSLWLKHSLYIRTSVGLLNPPGYP